MACQSKLPTISKKPSDTESRYHLPCMRSSRLEDLKHLKLNQSICLLTVAGPEAIFKARSLHLLLASYLGHYQAEPGRENCCLHFLSNTKQAFHLSNDLPLACLIPLQTNLTSFKKRPFYVHRRTECFKQVSIKKTADVNSVLPVSTFSFLTYTWTLAMSSKTTKPSNGK